MNPNKDLPSNNNNIDAKAYLEYIDKEMNFCGIITTFSLGCVLFMFDKLLSKNDALPIINFTSFYFISALISLTVAAFLLFRQRSNLAHHYGQISLETVSPTFTGKSLSKWLAEVDDWSFWNLYVYAISLIKCAFVEIFILLFTTFFKSNTVAQSLDNYTVVSSVSVIVVGIIITYFHNKKISEINDETLPHHKVYVRIGISNIHIGGVGIIAIAKIPKGELVFFPDDDEMVWVEEEKVAGLPEAIIKLYDDFCPMVDGRYGCPSSFNKLTPAWYLNNSNEPNVYCDKDYHFRAIRDIEIGEEVTSDYSAYPK
jgi:hypothetical protein